MSVKVSVANFKLHKITNFGVSASKPSSIIDGSALGNLLRACFMN